MKGLLIKDFKLMKIQRTFFIAMPIIGIATAFSMNDVSFMIVYMSIVMPMFVINTIGYDELDNGNAFLFTLPISRKGYVWEKYLFGILLGTGALVLSLLLAFCISFIQGFTGLSDILTYSPFIFSGMLLILSVFIPVQLKFGSEKSRIVIIIIGGGAAVLGFGAAKISEWLKIDTAALTEKISSLNKGALIAGIMALILCLLLLSIKISFTIIRKKEF